jgi:large subunit ribosomal protein L16
MKKKRLFRKVIFKYGITSFKIEKNLINGYYGYIVLQNHILNQKNLEAGRIILKREIKKKLRLLVIPRFNIPITKKALGVRMGKGKGPIKEYISFLKKDACLYEIGFIPLINALKILKKISFKFGVPVGLITRNGTRYYLK